MTLEEKVMQALKTAMKEKNRDKMDALRAVKSAILLEKTKGGSKELTEADEMKLLQKLVKQRKESAEIYQQQGREDLARVELNQIEVIESFLPEQMGPEEIEAEVKQIIAETGAGSIRDMGKVMGIATKKLAGRADGKTISEIVKRLLS
jgi:uncharacterized protein YqeY